MPTIQQMRDVHGELSHRGSNKLDWSYMNAALSKLGLKITGEELEILSPERKLDQLSFVEFHAIIKEGVSRRKKIREASKRIKEMEQRGGGGKSGMRRWKKGSGMEELYKQFGEFLDENEYEFDESLSTDPDYQVSKMIIDCILTLFIIRWLER